MGDNADYVFIGTIFDDHSTQGPSRLAKLQLHPLIQLKQHYEQPS